MLRGKIDAVARGRVLGWVWNDELPDEPVQFGLDFNGKKVGPFLANVFRPDLQKHGIGKGAHSFDVALNPEWLTPGSNEIRLLIDGQRADSVAPLVVQRALEELQETAPARSASAPPTTVRGRIEKVHRGMLLGWIWDTRSDDPVEFTLLVNEKPIGNFSASEAREDLAREGIGSGAHAFSIPLQRDWLAVGDNTFTIRTVADQQRLPDALVFQRADRIPKRTAAPIQQTPPRKLDQREILGQLSAWSTKDLVAFHAGLEFDVLVHRGRALLRDKKWEELALLFPITRPERRGRAELHVLIGRGLLQARDNDKAAAVLTAVAQQHPENVNAQFYASVACTRSGRWEESVAYGRAALKLSPKDRQYLTDHGIACRRYAAKIEADVNLRRSILLESIDVFRRALEVAPDRLEPAVVQMARSQLDIDRHADALETLDKLLLRQPDHVEGLLLRSQALVALNRVGEALQIAERVIELDPLRQGPRFMLRSLRALAGNEETRPQTFAQVRWRSAQQALEVTSLDTGRGAEATAAPMIIEFASNAAMALGTLTSDWLFITDEGVEIDTESLRHIRTGAPSWAGRVQAGAGGAVAWRRELLLGLAESGLIGQIGELPQVLERHGSTILAMDVDAPRGERQDLLADASADLSGPVVVMSRHGIVKFGGGEQFLDSMAEHYQKMGLEPIIVGVRPERLGEEGIENGRRFAFVDPSPASLRAFFMREKPRFVHVLSGLGYETAEALEYLNIPFVYGLHFWRDALGKTEGDTHFFEDLDKGPIARPSFSYIVQKAATVYSNSQYTRDVLEEAFHFRTPVIYSLPRDADANAESQEDLEVADLRDFVLLVNARSDKGLDLLIDVAKRLPQVPFVAIASQSDRREAEVAVTAAGLTNFHIIGHTSAMGELYARAKVTAVPSYRFVETFSRVCIEAQRFGTPVLGSTIGNVPYLLERSGVVLPENAEAWAKELERIYSDDQYYAELRARADENSSRFTYDTQARAVAGMISTLRSRVLIGVGSGIGNMLHVTPMIRNIVQRTGRKVDLVMTEDHENSLFLLQNDDLVNSVFSVRQNVLKRYYDTVLITHCFGDARLPFQARNVLFARDWKNFDPAGPLHEAVYNLEAAKQLLGIPYEEVDAHAYYIGNFTYAPPPVERGLRIGFHGGSKDGFWRSKRWPGHAELAQRLMSMGFEVSSFGVPEEYVPGTIDRTGGSISEMTQEMLGLHYLVSNDSGLMNIANALGIPVMAMFAPTNPLTRAPLRPIGRWIAVEKSCSPCEITREGAATFKAGLCQCIAEISVDRVEQAVLAHLSDVYPALGLLPKVA